MMNTNCSYSRLGYRLSYSFSITILLILMHMPCWADPLSAQQGYPIPPQSLQLLSESAFLTPYTTVPLSPMDPLADPYDYDIQYEYQLYLDQLQNLKEERAFMKGKLLTPMMTNEPLGVEQYEY